MIIIKITGAQCRVMTKKYTKFEKDSLKDSREKLRTRFERTDERTNGQKNRQTDGRSDFIMPQILFGGIKTFSPTLGDIKALWKLKKTRSWVKDNLFGMLTSISTRLPTWQVLLIKSFPLNFPLTPSSVWHNFCLLNYLKTEQIKIKSVFNP